MSNLFLTILRGLAQALVVAARQTQSLVDDEIASFILSLVQDPGSAGAKIALYHAASGSVAAAAKKASADEEAAALAPRPRRSAQELPEEVRP